VVLTAVDGTVASSYMYRKTRVDRSCSSLIWAYCSSVFYVPTAWRLDSTPSSQPCFSNL